MQIYDTIQRDDAVSQSNEFTAFLAIIIPIFDLPPCVSVVPRFKLKRGGEPLQCGDGVGGMCPTTCTCV